MKIGIFDPYLDTLGGGEKYMLTAASTLSEDNEVDIFWDPKDAEEIKKNVKRKFDLDLTRVHFTPNVFSKKTSFISRLLSTSKFDLVIFLSDGSIPFVGTRLFIHFQFPVEWINVSFLARLKILRTEKIICNSVFTKTFIDKKFHVNSFVLYPPADVRGKRENEKENIILHVGRFGKNPEGSNYKKQDVMIEIFKNIIDEGLTDWQFILVIGVRKEDSGKLQSLKKMAEGYPITIIENPSNDVLWEQYARAKIYWHATGFGEDLQKHPEHAEHFGIATVEAMGVGAVPVVIGLGGQTEIVEEGANGFLWNTKRELMEKTTMLIHDEKLWEQLSQKAVRRAEIFSGNRFCEELKEIIK